MAKTTTAQSAADQEQPGWPVLPAYLAGYVLLDWLSYIHPVQSPAITPWNPAPALSLVLFLRYGTRFWPLACLAAFAAGAIVRDIPLAPLHAALASLWLTAGYAALTKLLQKLRFDLRFLSLRDLFIFLAAVPPFTLAIGLGNAALYVYAGRIAPAGFPDAAMRFWIGGMVGVIVMAPLLLVHWQRLFAVPRIRVVAEQWAQSIAILVALWLVFGLEATDGFKFFYLLFLPVSWIAARSGMEGATVANLAIQLGVIGALQWLGHPADTVQAFQFLMLALATTGLFLGMAMSERRRALAAVAERDSALDQALRAAAVGEMTSALAHELNQPLMAISNYARASQHLAGELPGSDPLRRALDSLVGEVSHAGSVIHRLREYYRYGGMHRETLAARGYFAEALEPLGQRAARRGVRLVAEIADDAGEFQADPIQLGIVLHNLVGNAIEAVADLQEGAREVTVRVTRPDRFTLKACVEDRGPGVDPAQADELFSPLVSHKPQGMGLGLSICHSLIESHGGRIWYEARPGGGARFCFTLPVLEE